MIHGRTWIAAAALLGPGVAIASTAAANPVDETQTDAVQAEAERLFDEGKDLLAKDDWAAACTLFDASAKLVEAIPALVKVARCDAHDDRRVEAIRVYERALSLQPLPELERLVRAELFDLEGATPSIRVTFVAPEKGVTLLRNGRPLAADADLEHLWTDVGVAEHIEASANGYHPASFDVKAKSDGEVLDVRIRLERDAPPPAPPPPPPPDVRRPIAWAFTGGGGLGLALGAAFGVEYLVRRGSLFDDCTATLADGRHVCPASTSDRYDAAVAARTRAAVLLGVGGALAGTGIVLLVTAPARSAAKARVGFDRPRRGASDAASQDGVWVALRAPGALELGGAF